MVALFAAALSSTDTSTRVAAPAFATGAVEFGRTVIIGVPAETFDCTTVAPPKILCVAVRSGAIPIASVMMPELVRTAKRAATSLPSGDDPINTAIGD
ncbi:unannotated protein [freshwater metagenome]|uniref:Unannotated protein n=1 Tax=freshwater metagenome TaxID=449393 RepID=A0A6J6L1D3_9ZZZZ